MGKGVKKDRSTTTVLVSDGGCGSARQERPDRSPRRAPDPDLPPALASIAGATALTGAKKVKKKCCRSTPRCKGCPVLLMRATRLQEAGLTGKEFKKALKKARAA